MPRKVPNDLGEHSFRSSGATGGAKRVARTFVPTYGAPGSIFIRPRAKTRAFARRQLARLIEPRRLSS